MKGELFKMDIRKFDIYNVNLNGALGSEQGKVRPCVIVQGNKGNTFAPTVIIMPLTHIIKNEYLPTHKIIKIEDAEGLIYDSMILGEQIRTVDKRRLVSKIGKVTSNNSMNDIKTVCHNIFENFM